MLINIAYINKPGMGIQGRSERLIIGVYEGSVGGGGGVASGRPLKGTLQIRALFLGRFGGNAGRF